MYPFMFDPTFIVLIPAIILGMWAQFKVSSTFSHYEQVQYSRGKTASQVAKEILASSGISNVRVERVAGHLSDHFDPRDNVVRLSDSVHDSMSIAAIGVAAHEVGHAIQHAEKYRPIAIRNAIVPVVNIANYSWFFLVLAGMLINNMLLVKVGIIAYAVIALFQLITLPVEFDASSRALKILKNNYFAPDEYTGAKKVLQAAAMTYVAALVASLSQILRLVLIVSGRRDD